MDDHERKIIIEFCHLLEKSKQLFNGLRELPQYGHKQWHSYFGRTFDVYTKLWKFQQQHRAILDSKYGLKRWQIGEIASKIGQLYYHFYLRTSETSYLNEAFCFYYAIRARCYYTKASKEDKCELMVKKLRYYARFIVVCLLMKKVKLVRELTKELDRQITEYGDAYDPDDQIEWNVVVDEVKAFLQAEPVISVLDPDNYPVLLTYRLTPQIIPPLVERSPQTNLSLQEVMIVGSSSQQVKFSELTLDMFRMLQTLEREPSGDVLHMYDENCRSRYISTPCAPTKGYSENGSRPGKENPHKYLLFRPSPSQVLVYLASACNDLPLNAALLLYVSAAGHIVQSPKHPEDLGYDVGGLITTSKADVYNKDILKEDKRDIREKDRDKDKPPPLPAPSKFKETMCLHPGDLTPFTRKPMFLIVDSDNSYIFQNISRHFAAPLVILMSPLELPSPFHDRKIHGSLFTLFLHSPLTAVCLISEIASLTVSHWERGNTLVNKFICEAAVLVSSRCRVDWNMMAFMSDDFLRLLMLRYVFCEISLRMHRAFRPRTTLPRASPPLPEDLVEHPVLISIVLEIASVLQMVSPGNFVTLRELLDEQDDSPEDNVILDRLKIVAQETMPEGWIEWRVLHRTKEEIFGKSVDPQILNKLRFCLPTVEIAKAFDPDATHLSEKALNEIKLKMLSWAFMRALIISPPIVSNKIRGSAAATEIFNEAISALRPQIISGREAERILDSGSEEGSRKRRGSSVSSGPSKIAKVDVLEARMNDMFTTLMSEIKAIRAPRRPRIESSEDEEGGEEEDFEEGHSYVRSESDVDEWSAPGLSLMEGTLDSDLNFSPAVKEAQTVIPEPTAQIRIEGITCQRIGLEGWNRIRFKEVEKKLNASPVFSSLKINPELSGLNSNPSTFLARQDGMLGTISHGLLCQRKALAEELKEIVKQFPETSERIKKLLKESQFQSTSDDLLQYVCAHRADIIDMRRKVFKAKNEAVATRLAEIPPSPTHLFEEQKLTSLLKDAGGPSRVFYTQGSNKPRQPFRRQVRRASPARPSPSSGQQTRGRLPAWRTRPSQPARRPNVQTKRKPQRPREVDDRRKPQRR